MILIGNLKKIQQNSSVLVFEFKYKITHSQRKFQHHNDNFGITQIIILKQSCNINKSLNYTI